MVSTRSPLSSLVGLFMPMPFMGLPPFTMKKSPVAAQYFRRGKENRGMSGFRQHSRSFVQPEPLDRTVDEIPHQKDVGDFALSRNRSSINRLGYALVRPRYQNPFDEAEKKRAEKDLTDYKRQAEAGKIRLFFLDEIRLTLLATRRASSAGSSPPDSHVGQNRDSRRNTN